MRPFRFLIAFLVLIPLTACESHQEISVLVVDSETLQAIDSVKVEVGAGKGGDFTKSGTEGYTNREGRFEDAIMIGCSGGCYDIRITYTKEGYESLSEMNKVMDTVYLRPAP